MDCCNFAAPHTGHVYAIAAGPYVKIGFASFPALRLYALQSGSPVQLAPLYLAIGTKADEAALHARFAGRRVRGEWFWLNGSVRDWLDAPENRGCLWDLEPLPWLSKGGR
jgi:hypothetical protein